MKLARQMELSPRLRAVADWIPHGAKLVDVGTDHGYLPVWLVTHGVLQSVFATDVRPAPLERARGNAQRYHVEQQLHLRLCDGLAGIPTEQVDTISIAGMGGETIAEILAAAPWSKNCRCLLQPMRSQPELRRWLTENGFQITREQIILEGNVLYLLLEAISGKMPPLSMGECWAGRQTREDIAPLRSQYLSRLIRQAEQECAGLNRSTRLSDLPRKTETRAVLEQLQTLKKEWDTWQQSPISIT